MGRRRIERQHPHNAPAHPSCSPAPRFHAHCPSIRKALEIAFYEFRIWYLQAADELRAGKLEVDFPPGRFRPRLPFRRPPPLIPQAAPAG